jgi:hypothetical protein
MPHIILTGCDTNRQIEQIVIDVKIDFKKDTYNLYHKRKLKMNELEEKLGAILKEYFDDYEAEEYSNHEYNTRMNNY